MQTSGISANPLLMLNSLLRATGSAASDVFAPPSSNKTDQAKSAASTTVLPPSSATQLSFDSLLALQSVDNTDNVKTESLTASAASTPEAIFLKEAHKSPMQRLRDQILQSMGMTEESLALLPADERRAAEDKISKILREKIKEGMGVDTNTSESNDEMLSAVA